MGELGIEAPEATSRIETGGGAPAALAADVSRRGFLRGAALAGGGLVAASIAACAPGATSGPAWTYGPPPSLPPGTPVPTGAAPTGAASTTMPGHSGMGTHAPSGGGSVPTGWSDHDVEARNVIRRYVGNLAPALQGIYGDAVFTKLADILGAADNYPELQKKPSYAQVQQLVLTDAISPLTPRIEDGVKVFDLTIDEMDWPIDEVKSPIATLGYNKQWPGPTIRVQQGDRVRARFTNNMHETTSVHFHGVDFDDFFMDGVALVTQQPIVPGETYTYEFTARNPGSLMYHSHHNATDQVGRGLLGAFIVDPVPEPFPADRDYVWISNDALGGFTINGHGFPAVVPVLAAQGETVRIRFMNEGIMMHPWHLHGFPMRVVTRDGRPLGSAEFECDTLGVNPGERFDVLVRPDRLGIWAFHCHVLPHAEGLSGMFGMVSALIVVPTKADVDAIVSSLLA